MTLLSGRAEVADDWSPDAPATLTSVAAAAATSDRASTALQTRLERILSPSVDPRPGRSPSRAHFRCGPKISASLSTVQGEPLPCLEGPRDGDPRGSGREDTMAK